MANLGNFGDGIRRRVSYSKKKANDFQRQKDIMDVYDLWFGDYRDAGKIEKYNINYDLFNGKLDVNLYDEPICLNIDGKEVKFSYQAVTHYPLISQVANAMYGEMITRPFQPLAIDTGSYSQTLRNKKWNELIRNSLKQEVILPIQSEIQTRYLKDQGIVDQFQMTPEQIQQAQADIQRRLEEAVPEDILDFMQNDFQTPTQKQAQQLLDYYVAHEDITWKQQEGFKHAIITGEEVYFIGDRHGEPVIDLINPKYFTWAGSQNTEWIQDGTWAKYEQWFSLEDIQQRHAEYFTPNKLKELEGFAEPIGGLKNVGDPRRDKVMERTMYELSTDDWMIKNYGDINYKTKDGQKRILDVYRSVISKYGNEYGYSFSNYGIRETHIVWRDKRKLKRVTRIEGDEEKTYWLDEHYEPRPEDVKVVDVWVDEVWEGTKIGSTGDDVYLNIRPIPGQYQSIFNPFGVKLPYVGKRYNTHMNNSRNVSIVDLGKPWQMEFDTTMAQLKHDMATDYGNLFIMSLGFKPDGMEWQDWFDHMWNANIIWADFQKHGYGAIDPNLIRGINLSKASDMANKVQLLDYFRTNLVTAMNFNPTRIGAISEYSTNENVKISQSASYNQTEGYFETHRKIVEKALNMFMNRARILFKDNPKRFLIFDDVTRTELEISPDFWYSEWAIEFSTSTEDLQRVNDLRDRMLEFIQNGMSFEGILALTLAKTPSDIVDVLRRETKRIEAEKQQAIQQQQQQFEQQLQAEAQDKQLDREFKSQLEMAKLESQERRTQIDIDKFRRQNDVDMNFQADTIQKAQLELQVKAAIEDAKLALKSRELDIKEAELGLKKIQGDDDARIREKEANARIKVANSKPKSSS